MYLVVVDENGTFTGFHLVVILISDDDVEDADSSEVLPSLRTVRNGDRDVVILLLLSVKRFQSV